MFRLDLGEPVARLIIDRPEARNAIPVAGWTGLEERLAAVEQARPAVLIVAGAGGAFCAGADLREFAGMRGDESAAAALRRAMRGALDRLAALPIPTIAVVDGPCFGAGLALAIACDLRLAAGRSFFSVPPARIGLSYPQEDVQRLVALVGPGQAARLLFTGETIDGAEAARIGLVESVGEAEQVAALAGTIAANSAASLVALKRGVALAGAGCRSDPAQDQAFDRLMAGEALAARLDAMRRT